MYELALHGWSCSPQAVPTASRSVDLSTAHCASHPRRCLQRYLKPKYSRQKMKKEAIYMKTKRTRVALVEAFLADSHIQPF